MRREHRIAVNIPALDEAGSITGVANPQPDWVDTVVVVDMAALVDPLLASAAELVIGSCVLGHS